MSMEYRRPRTAPVQHSSALADLFCAAVQSAVLKSPQVCAQCHDKALAEKQDDNELMDTFNIRFYTIFTTEFMQAQMAPGHFQCGWADVYGGICTHVATSGAGLQAHRYKAHSKKSNAGRAGG